MDADCLAELQAWYAAQCDGDWEHTYGVEVGTLDNPGWWLRIDLRDTPLEGVPFAEVKDNYYHERDWMHCRLEGAVFDGHCGPLRLRDVIRVFLSWAAQAKRPPAGPGSTR